MWKLYQTPNDHQVPPPSQTQKSWSYNSKAGSVEEEGAATALCDLASARSLGSMDSSTSDMTDKSNDNKDSAESMTETTGDNIVKPHDGRGFLRANHRRNTWSTEEDELLTMLVKKYNGKHWDNVASNMPGRTAKQCHQRYMAVHVVAGGTLPSQ